MKNISGYVCIIKAEGKNFTAVAGKSDYDFLYNNLVPYDTKDDAREARDRIGKNKFTVYTQLAKINLNIAGSESERKKFEKRKSLILIAHDHGYKNCRFYGPVYDMEQPFHDDRQELGVNGFRAFESLKKAEYAAKELSRQVPCSVNLAEFRLERLEELVKGPAYTEDKS